jgi:hypothetical protein
MVFDLVVTPAASAIEVASGRCRGNGANVILGVSAGVGSRLGKTGQPALFSAAASSRFFDVDEVAEGGVVDQRIARVHWAGPMVRTGLVLCLSGESVAYLVKPDMRWATSAGWRCDRCPLDHRTDEGVALGLRRAGRPQSFDQPFGGV